MQKHHRGALKLKLVLQNGFQRFIKHDISRAQRDELTKLEKALRIPAAESLANFEDDNKAENIQQYPITEVDTGMLIEAQQYLHRLVAVNPKSWSVFLNYQRCTRI